MCRARNQLPCLWQILVTAFEVMIRGFRPTEILIPLPLSHQDHEAVYRAAVAACWPLNLTGSVQLIAAYEYSATSWRAGSAADAGRGGAPGKVKRYGCSSHARSSPVTRRQAGRTSPT